MTATILEGDMREVLATLEENSIHACVTDPPYHFGSIVKRFAKTGGSDRVASKVGAYTRHAKGFMGKTWDGGDVAFQPETWAAVWRVLKPGGHLVAFGGTKGFHRMACAIEDAGFEIRDTLCWLYGSGFPKSHNQDGVWEGWGTALKPAFEPILLVRKPLIGSVARNLAEHQTGAINVDGCRIDAETRPLIQSDRRLENHVYHPGLGGSKSVGETALGRWPANVLHDGSDEVMAAFPDAPGQLRAVTGKEQSHVTKNAYGHFDRGGSGMEARGDSGSAARFFYCAKADRDERNIGMEGEPEKPLLWSSGDQSPGTFQAEGTKRAAQNNHPTVKPVALMQWLVRLVTPKGGMVLDPFMGSGSTGIACDREGCDFIGVEQDPSYAEIARKRIKGDFPLFASVE